MTDPTRKITADAFAPPAAHDPGPAPMQAWIAIDKLIVDPSYQRGITRQGARNVQRIIDAFDWRYFSPVIVAPIAGGLYAIVDGQHRTTAALACGIEAVPCHIIQADRRAQAAAFAAVNGAVTAMSRPQLFHAEIEAGDGEAIAVRDAARAGGVWVMRSKPNDRERPVGGTLAVVALVGGYRKLGAAGLTTTCEICVADAKSDPACVCAPALSGIAGAIMTASEMFADASRAVAYAHTWPLGETLSEDLPEGRTRAAHVTADLLDMMAECTGMGAAA